STINFLAFVVLLMILIRNIIKLRRERLERKLGARFKTRIVIFFIALSTLPVIFLFFATTGFINRSIDKWFSLPSNEMLTNAWLIQNAYVESEQKGLNRTASTLARLMAQIKADRQSAVLAEELHSQQLIIAEFCDKDGRTIARASMPEAQKFSGDFHAALDLVRPRVIAGEPYDQPQISDNEKQTRCLVAVVPAAGSEGGVLAVARQIPENLVGSVSRIREFRDKYESLAENRKLLRRTLLQTL